MKIKYLFIMIMIISIKGYIIYDQGLNTQFAYNTGFSCSNSNTATTTVAFSGTFQVPPKIIIFPKNVSQKNTPSSAFSIDIISVTTQQFQLKIMCSNDYTIRYFFNWYAINDSRIAVLDYAKQTSCLDGSIYTHSHNFQKAQQAIVILQSWGMSSLNLNFYIEVYDLTSTNVKIKLNTFNSNLIEVGYQIVLGTQFSFVQSGLIEAPGGQLIRLTKNIPKLNYGIFNTPLQGFGWSNVSNLRVLFNQKVIVQDIQYTVETYDVTVMNNIRFNELWLFSDIQTPMYVYSYRVTKKYEQNILAPIKVMLLELNQQYINTGDFEISIPNTLTTVTIQIELKFQPGDKLIGNFLKCNDCGNQNVYKVEQNYLCGNNFIRYRLLFKQESSYDQNLQISIGTSDVTIKQLLYSQVIKYQIAKFQFVKIIA